MVLLCLYMRGFRGMLFGDDRETVGDVVGFGGGSLEDFFVYLKGGPIIGIDDNVNQFYTDEIGQIQEIITGVQAFWSHGYTSFLRK